MDKIISKIAGMGVLGLVLMTAISATGLAGAAAITTALAALGPGGMIGGILTLGAVGLISDGISEYGFDLIFNGVVKQLYKQGESKDSIRSKIQKYPISKSLKRKLYETIDNA